MTQSGEEGARAMGRRRREVAAKVFWGDEDRLEETPVILASARHARSDAARP